MTDLILFVIFILCIVIGYIVVKRSGGFLEQMLFQKSEIWYNERERNVRESNGPCRTETGADAGVCLREAASGRRRTGRSDRASREGDAVPARGPRAKRSMSFFGHGTVREARDLKAGIRNEWKTNRGGAKQQVWKTQ